MDRGKSDSVRLVEIRETAVVDVDRTRRAGPDRGDIADGQGATAGDLHEGGGRIVGDSQHGAGGLHVPAGKRADGDAERVVGRGVGVFYGGAVGCDVEFRLALIPVARHGQIQDRAVVRLDVSRLGVEFDRQGTAGQHPVVFAGKTAGLEHHISAATDGRRIGRASRPDADGSPAADFAFRGDAAGKK